MSSQSPKTPSAFLEKLGTVAGLKRDYFYCDLLKGWSQQAVRMGDFKDVRLNMTGIPSGHIELYNLKTDIGEKHNILA